MATMADWTSDYQNRSAAAVAEEKFGPPPGSEMLIDVNEGDTVQFMPAGDSSKIRKFALIFITSFYASRISNRMAISSGYNAAIQPEQDLKNEGLWSANQPDDRLLLKRSCSERYGNYFRLD